MGLGLTRLLKRYQVSWNLCEFRLRRKLLGFENAAAFMRGLEKSCIQPILLKNGATIGNNCDIESPLLFHNCTDFSNLIVGNNCHIGKNCFFDLRDKVEIAENVVISMQCTFITHMDMNKSKMQALYPASHAPIYIGSNSYLGANATVLSGVNIAGNCLIASTSLVTKDIPAYTLVGGVPARFIKKLNYQNL